MQLLQLQRNLTRLGLLGGCVLMLSAWFGPHTVAHLLAGAVRKAERGSGGLEQVVKDIRSLGNGHFRNVSETI